MKENSVRDSAELFVGIDGGGTKCKARLEDHQGKLLAEATTGPANAARDLTGSIANIIEACQQCLQTAGLDPSRIKDLNVGIGLAGINLPSVKKEFDKQPLPFANYKVTTDLHIACLGAHAGKNGTIVIIGTGSSGIAIRGEHQVILGGHGFQVGDKGSGAWIGKMAISYCLETLDGINEPNELANAVMLKLGCNKALDLVLMSVSAAPAFFGTLAPLVFKLANTNEPNAKKIIQDSASYITHLSENLLHHSSARLAYIGGVSQALMAYLPSSLRNKNTPATYQPESGAILFIKSTVNTEKYS